MRIAGTLSLDKIFLELNQGGNKTTLTAGSPSGNVTLTLPATTDTIVGRDTNDTLTNKTLTTPTINGGTLTGVTIAGSTVSLDDTDSLFALTLQSTSTLGANRILTLDVEDGARTITLAGNLTLAANLATSGANALTLTTTTTTNVTLPSTGTLATLAGAEALTNKTLTSPKINENVALTTTATKLNFLTSAGGTTGTASTDLVFSTSPTLVTPVLGVASATTINRVTITAPATGSTLTIADGKTFTVNNILTFSGTDSSSVAFGTGGTAAYTANKLSAFAATTSAELASTISDETGSGALVFGTSPTIATASLTAPTITGGTAIELTSFSLRDAFQGVFDVHIAAASATTPLTLDRTLTIDIGNATRQLSLQKSLTVTTGDVTFIGNASDSTITLPTTGTVATLAGSEVLTNKTLTGNIAVTLVSGAATVTLPTTTSTLATLALSETLTNKTLSASTLTGTTLVKTGNDIRFEDDDSSNYANLGAPSNLTGNRDIVFPDLSGTLMLTSGAQTVTNKNFNACTVAAYLQFQEESEPSTPASGNVLLYATTGKKFYSKDSAGVVTQLGGGGSGELNLIANPSDATNWSTTGAGWSGAVATTTTAGDLPLSGIVASAIKITSDSSAAAETSEYVSYAFTTPASLASKLKVEFYMRPGTNFIANEWTVSVYASSTRQALSTDSSAQTLLSSLTGKFTTTFDCVASTAYTLRFARVTNAGGNAGVLNIANVIVGPGIQPQGAAISDWQAYTPTGAWVSNTTYTGYWRRVGSSMEIDVKVATSGAPTSASLTVSLPSGYTINTAALAATVNGLSSIFGTGVVNDSDTTAYNIEMLYNNTSNVRALYQNAITGTQTAVNATAPITFGAGDSVHMHASFPIAEWTGSGTLNLAQNDVEYASNSSTADAADTTSFVYGPAGSSLPGALTTARKKRVRFLTPVQQTDTVIMEVYNSGAGMWEPIHQNVQGTLVYQLQNTATYGVFIQGVSSTTTDWDVSFQQYSRPTGATFGAAGEAWNTITPTKWRLKKFSGGQAVGFGKATSTSSGLITTFVPTVAASCLAVSSANYTVLDTDGYGLLSVTTGSSDRTITLPTAADNTGRRLVIKKADSGTGGVIVDGEGSETIDGAATQKLFTQYGRMTIVCDGTTWQVIELTESGTYTATFAYLANPNTGSPSSQTAQFLRVGNRVTVAGSLDIDPTSASATLTSISIALPIASNISDERQVAGTSVGDGSTYQPGRIFGRAATDDAQLSFLAADTANKTHSFHFTYQII